MESTKPYIMRLEIIELIDNGDGEEPTEERLFRQVKDVDIVGVTVDGIQMVTNAVEAVKRYEYGEEE